MRIAVPCFLLLLLAASAADSRNVAFGVQAVIGFGEDAPELVEINVPAGASASVDLADNLRLEFTAPSVGSGDVTITRLLRRAGSEFQTLHVARQGPGVADPRRNGYRICADRVTFISPAPEPLPTCEAIAAD